MNVQFKSSFARDLKKIRNPELKRQVAQTILAVEQAKSLYEIAELKKLKGGERYYRIRIGDYRIGILMEQGMIIFVRFLHRKDIYRQFP